MKRLFCVVEGRGELIAVPNLCMRIFQLYLHNFEWVVQSPAFRHPRDKLMSRSSQGDYRTCNVDGLKNIVLRAKHDRADGLLVLCDSDDDCPAQWGPAATKAINGLMVGGAVMALREYETWLLHNHPEEQLARVGVPRPELRRGAKEALARLVPHYLPSTHQLAETRKIDIARVRQRSDSFDKLVRVLASISGTTPPAR